ncbi:hypothetical protein [Lysobacter gummosus]|uniref:J domain-containing protein n=1 Tax=Lysobacter gummosus TaxID=262324 RepID=A0ABY3XIK0_9GAMM|nr:hypothetical protein [Lysobacter gummosus]ALN90999.1 dnaJ domain protein [Lysobacter gummosus]UNP31436.1 J domain-containing protein [Lysobacter gummosus]
MSAFERLGLEPTADEREIKRAYAREIKRTRPDEDPAGFQELHEAYQHCLAYAQYRPEQDDEEFEASSDTSATGDDDASATDLHERSQAESVAPDTQTPLFASHPQPEGCVTAQESRTDGTELDEPTQQFDLDSFLHALFAHATSDRPIDLQRWLHDLEPLYALELKHALRIPVARALAQGEPPPPKDAIDAIAEFFALITTDPREEHLGQILYFTYHRSERYAHFKRIIAQRCSPHKRPTERWPMHELLGPRFWPRRLLVAAVPMMPTHLIELLERLEQTDASLAQSQLDSASVGFWRRATDRRWLNYRRVLVGLGRCALYYLATVGLASLLMGLDPVPFAHAARNIAALFIVWLTSVALWAGLLHFKDLIERRWGWDTAVIVAIPTLLTCLLVGYFAPIEGAFFAGLATVALIMVRGRIHSVPAVAFYVASITALCALVPLLGQPMDLSLPYIAVAAGALQIAHDVVYARAHKISVAQTRKREGWLWALAGLTGLAALALLFAPVIV